MMVIVLKSPTTLLISSPAPALFAEIVRERPQWTVIPLGEIPPPGPFSGRVWGFVDWLGPAMSGLELCRRLREAEPTAHAHLTMVLDEPSPEARRRALQAGADDYLIGPLNLAHLLERVESHGGHEPGSRRQWVHGPIVLDPAAHQVRVRGRLLMMRPNEYRLLAHFLAHPDQVFSRATLIEHLGKDSKAIDERTVDVWVGRLRRALAAEGVPDPLRTVRSLGYVLDSLES